MIYKNLLLLFFISLLVCETTSSCANDGYCYEEARVFIGLVWNNSTSNPNLDLYTIRNSLVVYINDSYEFAKIQKLTVLIADTNGILHTCNGTNQCIDYLQANFANDVLSKTFNSNDSLYTEYSRFFTSTSNSTLNLAYIYTRKFECSEFSQSNFLEMLVNDSDKMVTKINEDRIYTYFMNTITTLNTNQDCRLINLLKNASQYFKVEYNHVVWNLAATKPDIDQNTFSLFRQLYTNNTECKYVGYHPKVYAPNCKTWTFYFGIVLDYSKISPAGFEEFKKFLIQLMKPCGQMNIEISLFTTGPNNIITCKPYSECEEKILNLNITQISSKGNQTFDIFASYAMINSFSIALKYDIRAFYFITNVDCDKIPNVINFQSFQTWEKEMYSFGVFVEMYHVVFRAIMFNQSSEFLPLCSTSMEPLFLTAKEFAQPFSLGINESLSSLIDSLELCMDYSNSLPSISPSKSLYQYGLEILGLIGFILIIGKLIFAIIKLLDLRCYVNKEETRKNAEKTVKNHIIDQTVIQSGDPPKKISSEVQSIAANSFSENRPTFCPKMEIIINSEENIALIEFLATLLEMKNVNYLSFPGFDDTFGFKIDELIDRGILETNSKHVVKKFEHIPTHLIMATKFLIIPQTKYKDKENEKRLKALMNELENFRRLWECSEIVDCYGYAIHEGYVLLFMELMDMSLKQFYLGVYNKNAIVPEKIVGYVFVKIINALVFCKSKRIMHRDIKPNNILIKQSGEIKLCDFGESRYLEDSLASTRVGTIAYWPPEHFEHERIKYDIRFDLWSLGITLNEVILNRLPYMPPEDHILGSSLLLPNTIKKANFNEIVATYIKPMGYSDMLCEVLLLLCAKRMEDRPNLEFLQETQLYHSYESVQKEEIADIIRRFGEI